MDREAVFTAEKLDLLDYLADLYEACGLDHFPSQRRLEKDSMLNYGEVRNLLGGDYYSIKKSVRTYMVQAGRMTEGELRDVEARERQKFQEDVARHRKKKERQAEALAKEQLLAERRRAAEESSARLEREKAERLEKARLEREREQQEVQEILARELIKQEASTMIKTIDTTTTMPTESEPSPTSAEQIMQPAESTADSATEPTADSASQSTRAGAPRWRGSREETINWLHNYYEEHGHTFPSRHDIESLLAAGEFVPSWSKLIHSKRGAGSRKNWEAVVLGSGSAPSEPALEDSSNRPTEVVQTKSGTSHQRRHPSSDCRPPHIVDLLPAGCEVGLRILCANGDNKTYNLGNDRTIQINCGDTVILYYAPRSK